MVEASFSKSFKKAYKKKIKNQKTLEQKFWTKLEVFLHDPFDQSLRTHKLTGHLKDQWSFSVDYDTRVLFFFASKEEVVFINIGTHDEVY